MRKLFVWLVILLLCFASPVTALDLTWDQNTDNAVGYVFFWTEVNDPNSEVFSERVPGVDSITYTVAENLLKPNILYNFWVTAYDSNDLMSDPSNIVDYTRVMNVVPPDNLPTETYPTSGPEVTQGLRKL